MVKLACALVPTATVPKLMLEGRMASCGGVRPEPVTVLVELPPLLVKVTTLLKLTALSGAKLMATELVWRARMVKGLPDWMVKGELAATVPERVRSPVLTSWKLSVLVWPMMTGPKARLAGLSESCGGKLVAAM
jgi:hypothetical protein